jgi:hypothetical protein
MESLLRAHPTGWQGLIALALPMLARGTGMAGEGGTGRQWGYNGVRNIGRLGH